MAPQDTLSAHFASGYFSVIMYQSSVSISGASEPCIFCSGKSVHSVCVCLCVCICVCLYVCCILFLVLVICEAWQHVIDKEDFKYIIILVFSVLYLDQNGR